MIHRSKPYVWCLNQLKHIKSCICSWWNLPSSSITSWSNLLGSPGAWCRMWLPSTQKLGCRPVGYNLLDGWRDVKTQCILRGNCSQIFQYSSNVCFSYMFFFWGGENEGLREHHLIGSARNDVSKARPRFFIAVGHGSLPVMKTMKHKSSWARVNYSNLNQRPHHGWFG